MQSIGRQRQCAVTIPIRLTAFGPEFRKLTERFLPAEGLRQALALAHRTRRAREQISFSAKPTCWLHRDHSLGSRNALMAFVVSSSKNTIFFNQRIVGKTRSNDSLTPGIPRVVLT